MHYTANNVTGTEDASKPAIRSAATSEVLKEYTPPQIEDFGRIADLTQNLSNVSPNDFGGGSFST